jgi:hypothetical protein
MSIEHYKNEYDNNFDDNKQKNNTYNLIENCKMLLLQHDNNTNIIIKYKSHTNIKYNNQPKQLNIYPKKYKNNKYGPNNNQHKTINTYPKKYNNDKSEHNNDKSEHNNNKSKKYDNNNNNNKSKKYDNYKSKNKNSYTNNIHEKQLTKKQILPKIILEYNNNYYYLYTISTSNYENEHIQIFKSVYVTHKNKFDDYINQMKTSLASNQIKSFNAFWTAMYELFNTFNNDYNNSRGNLNFCYLISFIKKLNMNLINNTQ